MTPEEMSEHFNKTNAARKAIIEHCKDKRSTSGIIKPCPICKTGDLRYARAYNGHVHAACTNHDCVRWME